jgi:phosphoglycerate dehydrogenase-like enzyme
VSREPQTVVPPAQNTVVIATPIEADLIAQIRGVAGYEVLADSALVPAPRYPSDHRGKDGFVRDAPAQARWNAWLGEAEILLGIPGESPDQLADAVGRAPRLRWVQCMYAGAGEQVRNAKLSAADRERIAFTTSAGVHGSTLSEFFFMGLLALRKDIRRLERTRTARFWDHWAMGELRGSTLAIVGMGAIGRTIAQVARAFGMRVVAITRDGKARDDADASFPTSRLIEAVAQADAVVLTLPGTPLTEKLFSREVIASMQRSAILGNVGRGSVVDQDALIDALARGAIAGAVLDVFAPEPLPPDNPLWTMENVVFAPHTAALSDLENARVVDLFCDNLARFADDRPLRNRINPTEFY